MKRKSTKQWLDSLPANTSLFKGTKGQWHVGSDCYDDKDKAKHKDITKAVKMYLSRINKV